jgi:hypothetical protein
MRFGRTSCLHIREGIIHFFFTLKMEAAGSAETHYFRLAIIYVGGSRGFEILALQTYIASKARRQ